MTTTTISCAYSLTAVGVVAVGDLAAAFQAVPVDLSIPASIGLLYDNDVTLTVGQVVTRTIRFRAVPASAATATATRFPGDTSGSPIDALTLTGAGSDYAAPPIVDLKTGSPNVPARAIALMEVDRVIIIDGGMGYDNTVAAQFVGGQLGRTGVQAVAGAITRDGGGAITAIAVSSRGGPFQVPPSIVLTGGGSSIVSAAVLSPSLRVSGLTLLRRGFGYETAPTPAFNPLFSSCCPDTAAASQKSFLRNWMTQVFQAALHMPVIQADPVIA